MPRHTNRRRPDRDRRPQRHKTVLHDRDAHRTNAFRCVGCRLDVPVTAPGTAHRNHCRHCLASRHVDRRIPGDRAADCRGRMEALGMSVRPDGEWLLIHQCRSCVEGEAEQGQGVVVAGDAVGAEAAVP